MTDVATKAEAPTTTAAASAEAFRQVKALHHAGKYAEAEALLRAAIARDPNNSDLRNARGVMFAAMNRHLDALWCYRDALALSPRAPGIWTNLGNALTQLKYLKGALDCHRRAIEMSGGGDALLHHNLATSLAAASRPGEAVIAFPRALDIKPDYRMAQWDRGRSYLYLGNYRRGWVDYEARKVTGQLPAREVPGAAWTGEPYAGKRLVLLIEQGF